MKNYTIKYYYETPYGYDSNFVDGLTQNQAYEIAKKMRRNGETFEVTKEVNGEIVEVNF